MKQTTPKLFILDTNVILHDASCIDHFEENEIVIPISVLEELDQFKRGNEQINHNARQFLRQLDKMSNGIHRIKKEKSNKEGKINVVVNHSWNKKVRASFNEDSPDHRIINCAFKLYEKYKDRKVILVSKDTNMRLKARSLGMSSEDYTTDKISSIRNLYSGTRLIENIDTNKIESLSKSQKINCNLFPEIKNLIANENFILRSGKKSVLAIFDPFENKIIRISPKKAYGIVPKNAEQSFAMQILLDKRIQLVSLLGNAGTGKTLIALATALESRSNFKKIYLARPIIPLSNRDLGFLPGDIQSKLDPYMQPLFDNLSVIKNQFKNNDKHIKKINQMLEEQKLLITPLAYIRGRSLQKAFFIVDEAQNLTPHEVKTIITRAGEGTKIIFTGDINQIDHPYLDKHSNGLTHLISKMRGEKIFAHITLEKGERSQLAEIASGLL